MHLDAAFICGYVFLSIISVTTPFRISKTSADIIGEYLETLKSIPPRKNQRETKVQTKTYPKTTRNNKKLQKTKRTSQSTFPKHEFSYKPVKISNLDNYKGWLIIGYTDITYLRASLIWLHRMSILGYTNYKLVAMDEQSYSYLQTYDKMGVISDEHQSVSLYQYSTVQYSKL